MDQNNRQSSYPSPSTNVQTVLPGGYQPQIQVPPQEIQVVHPPQYVQPPTIVQPVVQSTIPQEPGMKVPSQQYPSYPPTNAYQPQQNGYQPQQSAPITQAPVAQGPMYIAPQIFNEHPQPMTCMNCKTQGMSVTEKTNGAAVWISAGAIFLVCCCCAWVPFVVDTCKDTNHRCATCGMVAGTKKMI
ncbi:hypothetical protein HDV01_000494 [Terramyces sp. JEL0728]|nr:hypothetical protein HDV01_000494 [Terramyces sp. JEL0728]